MGFFKKRRNVVVGSLESGINQEKGKTYQQKDENITKITHKKIIADLLATWYNGKYQTRERSFKKQIRN